MSLNQADIGLALFNAAVQATVGITVAVAVHWMLAKHLWKRPCETPHELGYWLGCWLACLALGISVGKFIGQALYGRVSDNDFYLLLMNGVVVAFIYGLLAYCVGWIYGRLFRSTKPTTLTAHMANVPSAGANSPPYRAVPPLKKVSANASESNEFQNLASLNDEALYEQALTEITDGSKRLGLWAMALEQTSQGGSTEGAYIALRVKQLKTARQTNPITQHTKTNDDNGGGSHRSPSRGTKSILGAILLLTLGGSAIVAFNKYSESPNADLKALSKEVLVSKMTDRTQSYKVRSAFGSKLVDSGRLYAFKATQIPDRDHSMHSQAVSDAVEGALTWWRHPDDTTLMILYNPTPLEINGIGLNVYSGKCNVAAETTVAALDYQLSTSLRPGDLVAYSLVGLMANETVARQGKEPTCIDVVSTW
jgi:hypothetical protein